MKAKKQEASAPALHVVAEPKKGLDHYLGLPYTFQVFQSENADGPYWAASVNEIRGVNGHGDTPEAALSCARDSLRYWLTQMHVDFTPLVALFIGELEQMPPQFSAKKVGGVRAYELARKGEVAALTPKKVTVYEFEILGITGSTVRFRVRSSAGTYVRSLAHELGQAAGVPAHLKELRRTAIGTFTIDDAISYERLENAPVEEIVAPPQFQPLNAVDLPLEKLRIDWSQQGKLMRGQTIIMTPSVPVKQGDLLALGNPHDQLVAIGEVVNVLREGGAVEVKPKVVLAG